MPQDPNDSRNRSRKNRQQIHPDPAFRALENPPRETVKTLQYPRGTPRSESDFITFTPFRQKNAPKGTQGARAGNQGAGSGGAGSGGAIRVNGDTVVLYMPSEIKTTYGAGWTERKFKPGGLGSLAGLEATGRDIGETIKEKITGALQSGSGADSLARERGIVRNPNVEFLFEAMDARKFSYSFQFAAKNVEDTNAIRELIFIFKKHMHPELIEGAANGRFIKFPHLWNVAFNTNGEYFYKTKDAALVGCVPTYGGTGAYSSFANGAPVMMGLDLEFQETTLLTSSDFTSPGDEH
jgi:hypothetical protein